MAKTFLNIGNYIKVAPNTLCPNYKSLSISGWHGKVIKKDYDANNDKLLLIQWDSSTLMNMPLEFIMFCESNELDYTKIYLYGNVLIKSEPRNSKFDVKTVKKYIEEQLQLFKKTNIS